MKNIIAVLTLLTLSACCGCPPPATHSKAMAMAAAPAHKQMACSTAKVSGMTCEACATTVSENLKKLPGVEDVAVGISTGTVKIYTDGAQKIEESAIKHIIERSGYTFNSMQPTCE